MTNKRLDGSGTVCRHCGKAIEQKPVGGLETNAWVATDGTVFCVKHSSAISAHGFAPHAPAPAEQPQCDNPRCDGLTHNHGDRLQVVCPVASAEQPPLREVSEGVYTSDIKPHRVDDVRIAEIINRGPVAAATAEGPEWIMGHMNELICSDRSCGVRKPGPHRSLCKFSPAEGPRPEICLTCGTPKKYFENSAAQPSPDAAKVEEIIEAILQEMRTQEFHLPAKFRDKVTAILRRYFPAGQRETK